MGNYLNKIICKRGKTKEHLSHVSFSLSAQQKLTTKVKISFDLVGNDDKIEIYLTIDPMFAAVMYEIKF